MNNPHDNTEPGFLTRALNIFVGILLILAIVGPVALMIISIYRSAGAHENGQPFWMSDQYYKQQKHDIGCCGPNDCKPVDEVGATIKETEDGFYVTDPRATASPDNTEFFSKSEDYSPRQNPIPGKKGLYFTEDEQNRPYVCVYSGRVVCVAVQRKAQF